jgi:hypothetical protein
MARYTRSLMPSSASDAALLGFGRGTATDCDGTSHLHRPHRRHAGCLSTSNPLGGCYRSRGIPLYWLAECLGDDAPIENSQEIARPSMTINRQPRQHKSRYWKMPVARARPKWLLPVASLSLSPHPMADTDFHRSFRPPQTRAAPRKCVRAD